MTQWEPGEARTLVVGGSVRRLVLDARIWNGLEEICRRERMAMEELLGEIARRHPGRELGAAAQYVAVLYFWSAVKAGDGPEGPGGGDRRGGNGRGRPRLTLVH